MKNIMFFSELAVFDKVCKIIYYCNYGLGAKSQILSSVAPPRKKKLVTIFSQGQVWGPQKPMFY